MKKLLFSLAVILVLGVGCGATTATDESPVVTSSQANTETITAGDSSVSSPSESDAAVVAVTGHTLTLHSIDAEDGNMRPGGFPLDCDGLIVGDDSLNEARQAFLSFDISEIPAGATVKSASLDVGVGTKEGYPFALAPVGVDCSPGLGLLGIYDCQYGASVSAYDRQWGPSSYMSREDFTLGFPSDAIKTYSASSPPAGPFSNAALTSALQARVNEGDSRFRLRLQFEEQTNYNVKIDALVLANPELVVTYED